MPVSDMPKAATTRCYADQYTDAVVAAPWAAPVQRAQAEYLHPLAVGLTMREAASRRYKPPRIRQLPDDRLEKLDFVFTKS
jgi:hypothetical protein